MGIGHGPASPLATALLIFSAGQAVPAAEFVNIGVRGGVPLAEAFRAGGFESPGGAIRYTATTTRWVVGPTVEVDLPGGLALNFDALYRRLSYQATQRSGLAFAHKQVTTDHWEFPLMVRYRLPGASGARPFLAAGPSWNRITRVRQNVSCDAALLAVCAPGEDPAELVRRSAFGYALGVGIGVRLGSFRLTPELRFSRRGRGNFQAPIVIDVFRSTRNQWDLLLGITR